MKTFQTYIAVLCAVLVATPATFGQQNPGVENRGPLGTEPAHWYSGIAQPYQARVVPPVSVSNSSRIDALLRAGNLYLSLSDAIALALRADCPIYVDMEVIKASRNTVPPDDVEESELSSTEEEWPDVIGEAGDLPM